VAKAKKTKFLGYDFAVPIFANQSVSKFWFEVNEGNESAPIVYDNGGKGYVFQQDEVIYVPWLSTKHLTSDGTGLVSNGFTIVAGVSGGFFFFDSDGRTLKGILTLGSKREQANKSDATCI